MDKKNIVLLILFVILMFASVVILHHNQQEEVQLSDKKNNLFENMMTAESLKAHPDKELVAEEVINNLYALHENGELGNQLEEDSDLGYPIYYHLSILDSVASADLAPRIGVMLEWDEWYEQKDRLNRGVLIRIMEKIGGKEEISYLNTFAEKVKEVDYSKGENSDHLMLIGHEPFTIEELKTLDQEIAMLAATRIVYRIEGQK